jgi:uncharacterized protein (TIGR00251 family)
VSRLDLEVRKGVLHVSVRVKPRASRTRILGVREGALEVAVAAAPVDGRANAALVDELSRFLRLPRRDIRVLRGKHGRNKQVAIENCERERLCKLLGISG